MSMPFPVMPNEYDDLKRRIEQFLFTDPRWKGTPLNTRPFGAPNSAERDFVNKQGALHGCHTCLTLVASDANQPWIGDHIPPTRLSDAVKRAYQLDGVKVRLLPSCSECSSLQSALINRLNTEQAQGRLTPFDNLDEDEKGMLAGGYSSQGDVISWARRVNATQGGVIQKNGAMDGCHICSGSIPQKIYHADHCPPQEFGTSYMPQLCAKLGIPLPKQTVLRPQCARCSGEQGGLLANVVSAALDAARRMGITAYK